MKTIEINNKKYNLITNYKDAFDEEDFLSKFTDYFYDYDYIVGDIAYGKLRLKGFYHQNNKNCKNINNIKYVDKYIENNCAYNCKYFILKKYVQK